MTGDIPPPEVPTGRQRMGDIPPEVPAARQVAGAKREVNIPAYVPCIPAFQKSADASRAAAAHSGRAAIFA